MLRHAPSSISREIRNAIAVATVPTMPPPLVVRLGGCAASALEVLTAMLNRIPEPSFEKT